LRRRGVASLARCISLTALALACKRQPDTDTTAQPPFTTRNDDASSSPTPQPAVRDVPSTPEIADGPPISPQDEPIAQLQRMLTARALAALSPDQLAGLRPFMMGGADYRTVEFGFVSARPREANNVTVRAMSLRNGKLRYYDLTGYIGRSQRRPGIDPPSPVPIAPSDQPPVALLFGAATRIRAAVNDAGCALPMIAAAEKPSGFPTVTPPAQHCDEVARALATGIGVSPVVRVSIQYPEVEGYRGNVSATAEWRGTDWVFTSLQFDRLPAR